MSRLLTERLLGAADRVPPLAAHDLRALLEVAADTINRLEEELVASRDALVACARASSAAEVGLIVDAALAAHHKGGEV